MSVCPCPDTLQQQAIQHTGCAVWRTTGQRARTVALCALHCRVVSYRRQVYLSTPAKDAVTAVDRLSTCVTDINDWMTASRLLLTYLMSICLVKQNDGTWVEKHQRFLFNVYKRFFFKFLSCFIRFLTFYIFSGTLWFAVTPTRASVGPLASKRHADFKITTLSASSSCRRQVPPPASVGRRPLAIRRENTTDPRRPGC